MNNIEGYSGHRQRLRNRFIKAGLDGLHDYEAIELLLTYAIPRKDVKPAAKLLIERFGNISGIMNASPAELLSVPGLGKATIVLILLARELVTKSFEEKLREKQAINSATDVVNFLRLKIGSGKKENLVVFYLNSCRHMIEYDLYKGTVDNAAVYAREITERALICHACGVILAHNHPSGNCTPSPEDIILTNSLKDTLARLGIKLIDHILVTPQQSRSVLYKSDLDTLQKLYAVCDTDE